MTVQEMVGQFHTIILYFPIVLFTAALVCDGCYYFDKSRALMVGHWMIIAAVLTCIPTIITGLAASASFDPNDLFISKHRMLGYSTGIFGSLYAGLRIAAMCWKIPIKPSLYISLSVMMVALVSWTSDYGWLITSGQTSFKSEQTDVVTSIDA